MEIIFEKKYLHLSLEDVVRFLPYLKVRLILANVEGEENAKNILCRNITIYGHCRYEKDGEKANVHCKQ